MNASAAAQDFLNRINENCRGLLAQGRNALVPIILDGENAWEYYDHNGRPFFRELYSSIQSDPAIEAITLTEAFRRVGSDSLDHIFPGSWIYANFDVWIGAEEDNNAWRLLLDARKAFDAAKKVPAEKRKLAREELLIAEGSDWNWWYGPEHDSANRVDFDQIYREHLANVYRALGLTAPPELSRPILKVEAEVLHTPATGAISPKIDGVVDSYFEWLGAGIYRVDRRSGSMHGKRTLVKELRYGANDSNLFLRIDFAEDPAELEGVQVIVETPKESQEAEKRLSVAIKSSAATVTSGTGQAAFHDVLEMAIPAGASAVRVSFWQDGLPIDAIPPQDFLRVADSADWNV